MTTAEILIKKLTDVLSGQPWYGTAVYGIVDSVIFETAFEKPANGAHTIAEILLHMISWTEEVMDRLNEKPAGMPVSGDWPETGSPTEEKWTTWKDDLNLVNVNLVKAINSFAGDKWDQPITDRRGTESVTTYKQLIEGFIEHQVYHAGQIALLNSMIGG